MAHPPLIIALFVSRDRVQMAWASKTRKGSCSWEGEQFPSTILQEAQRRLADECKDQQLSRRQLTGARWRVVIAGGYSTVAQRSPGIWSTELSQAASVELEREVPASFDELITAAVPINKDKAWVCALPLNLVLQWHGAAEDLNLCLEGLWSTPGVFVDCVLEKATVAEGYLWSDGHHVVEVKTSKGESDHICIQDVRSFVASQAEVLSPSFSWLFAGEREPATSPAYACLSLKEVEPSQSINLLRGPANSRYSAIELNRWMQRTSIGACIALSFWILGNWYQTRQASRNASLAHQHLLTLWRSVELNQPLPALPVNALQRRVSTWQAAQAQIPLESVHPLEIWSALVQALPENLTITLRSIRLRGNDVWVEGSVPNGNDARRLEAAWSKVATLVLEPLHLTSGSDGSVTFSARLTVK